ncbi:MAG: Ig-like domain-containing protein, partial [Promethearchaeota archaeon]
LSLANYTHNHLYNPDLESWSSPQNAYDWSEYPSNDQYTWTAQSPWPVYEGSYSLGLQCRSPTGQSDSTTNLDLWDINADMRKTNLTFSWYLDQNLHPDEDYFMVDIVLRNTTSSSWYYIYYVLNGTASWHSNSTNNIFFLVDEPSHQWNRFSHNLTAEVLAVPGYNFPDAIGPDLVVYEIWIEAYAYSDTTQYLRGFLDDFTLENDTTTFIGGATSNGNFETGSLDPWYAYSNEDPGYISQSATAHSGAWSVNSTSLAFGNYSHTELEQYVDIRATSLNQANLSFWWHLDLEAPDYDTRSWVYLSLYDNYNIYRTVNYWLGYGGFGSPYTNSSNAVYFHAPNFNTTNSWTHFSRNLWADAKTHFTAVTELYIRYIEFHTQSRSAGSRVVTLIDDVHVTGHSLNGGSFEDQPAGGYPVRGFTQYTSSRFTVTDTMAYSGSKAANLTLSGAGLSESRLQYVRNRPFNGTRETYLDLMWNLQDTTAGNSAYIRVWLANSSDSFDLHYYLCGMPGVTNSSNDGYFNVTGADTVGSWVSMHRDLVHDFEAIPGFGTPASTLHVHEVRFSSESAGGGRLELLLDDFWLYDDPAPEISNIDQTPLNPEYDDPTNISCDAEDQDLDTVMLHYRTNGGGWQHLQMPETFSYDQDIPGQPYDTLVEYYITANDTWGMTTTDDNGGSYYSYTVTDTVDPDITNIAHNPTSPQYAEIVTVSCDAYDAGSDISSVQLSYRVDTGTWSPLPMSEGPIGTYSGQIPAQAWSAVVEYYITATDGAGNPTVDDNTGSYYSYTVGDDTDPTVIITAPSYGDTVSGTVVPNFLAADAGSGLAFVALYVNNTLVQNATSMPYALSWDTTTYADGPYIIRITAQDLVGNTASDTVIVTVSNYTPLPPFSPLLLGGIIVAVVIIVIVVIVALWFFRFRKPK